MIAIEKRNKRKYKFIQIYNLIIAKVNMDVIRLRVHSLYCHTFLCQQSCYYITVYKDSNITSFILRTCINDLEMRIIY